MRIRPESPSDYAAIAEVVEAACRPNEARLVELIRASEQYVPELALVAEDNRLIVGHVMFSYVTLRGAHEFEVLELAPVAVTQAQQSRGIGSALIRAGIEKAAARREPLIVVLGHPPYFPRFGFEPAHEHGIEAPSPAMAGPAFMVLRLSAYQEHYRGQVIFPPAFDVT
jgi:putative acetyltransferase